MHKTVVITSIFPPTPSVRKWAFLRDWKVIVAGDKKTPSNWSCDKVIYLSVEDQETLDFRIARLLPWNHYSRKLLGYLVAIKKGAELIVDSDDDNMPKEDWMVPHFDGNHLLSTQNMGFVNVYSYFTEQKIWPRGFPLNRICDPDSRLTQSHLRMNPVKVGVWQGLADKDPDVDAIYRMTVNASCIFNNKSPVVLNSGTICPFNSQNTAFIKPVFTLLYLPSSVSFRATDIVRGLVAQPILWSAGLHLGFTNATVIQERNIHDNLSDFESEIPVYLNSEKIIDTVEKAVSSRFSIDENLYNAYESLFRKNMVQKYELDMIASWIQDVQDLMKVLP